MPASVFLKSLRDLRRSLAWWSLGLVGLVALMVSVYPTVRDNPDLNQLVQEYPEALQAFIAFGGNLDYASGAGYLGSELFSFMVPLLLLVAAIGHGAGAIAGEEERGTLDLLLSHPVTRQRVALEKLAALASELALLGTVLWAALVVGVLATGMDVSAGELAAATGSAAALALAFGSIAFMLGGATGHRVLAIGVAAAAAVAAYLVNSLAALVELLRPLQKATPFYHYTVADPLRHGVAVWHLGFLLAVAGLAAALGVAGFCRRDVGT